MATFLTIAMREGISVVEMANLTGQTNASSTRNLQSLGAAQAGNSESNAERKINRPLKVGLGLVRLEADPVDGRKKSCYITTAGQALLQKIHHHLGD